MSAANLPSSSLLGDPRLRRDLTHTIRRRADRLDVDDVVQATLAEALAAKALPTASEEVRRFVFAIAQQKVADLYRRRARERRLSSKVPIREDAAAPHDRFFHLKAWLERTLPHGESARQTFGWMLREADGETLAEIAAADDVSVLMVRQRVSRLRRWLRARWIVMGAAALGLLALLGALVGRREPAAKNELRPEPVSLPPPSPPPPGPEPARRIEQPLPTLPPPVFPSPLPTASGPLKAALASHSESTFDRDHRATTVTSYYTVDLPKIDLRACATAGTPHGISHVALAFRNDGTVDRVVVDSGVVAGRPEARCVESLYARVTVRPFKDGQVIAGTFFSLVPEALPGWLTKFEADAGAPAP